MNYKLYNSDAYTIIDKLLKKDLQVDHIITDPPYNISKKNNFKSMKSANRQGVDFGEWDKNFDLYSWIANYGKLIRKGGSFIIFTSYRYISYIVDELEKSGFIVKDILKWIKTNPMPRNVNRRYVQDTEFAIWAVKPGEKWIFNKKKEVSYLRAEFKTSVVAGRERTKHPTQKSLSLMENIITIHTNKVDIILDPFMGSGTTGVAAIKHSRRFIGVEIDKIYYKLAKERLNEQNNIDE
ncbi:site-specific DNA-methyltransferase [Streptococcus sp. sy010]|uniref:DNA-methyltransferase n=1 Tax=Streptococcus sp. sy010 TaxID=2600148 RepID=UPI0011B6B1FF|nr:site-specific DNA-methyltransferase [Streptococcus sp. sy010]TWT16473.1 site-specific DNA-methyltransferase [Streptococcus sp. sy010]